MLSNQTCPRCCQPISVEKMLENVIICSCGWSGSKSLFQPKRKKWPVKKLMLTSLTALLAFMIYDSRGWGHFYLERIWYKTLSTLKMTTAKDEARMGYICKKLKKHSCAVQAYTTALNKSPKSYGIAGVLAIELVINKQYDQALLTFQNYFSHKDGTFEHKRYFARALSREDYVSDATEWYYKSLEQNPKSLETAVELIRHLAKNEIYEEALGVIGHYNRTFPKTIKKWKKLTHEVKRKYVSYNSKYNIREIKIMGFNKYLYAPVSLVSHGEVILFMVDPKSEFLTLDKRSLDLYKVQYKRLGTQKVTASNGSSVTAERVIIPNLNVGPFQLKNIKALACDNCANLLGKNLLKRLSFKTQDNNKGVRYITLKN